MEEHGETVVKAEKDEKQVELQLGGRHLTLAVVGLALFGGMLFLLGRWSERVARPGEQAAGGIEVTSLPGSGGTRDPAEPRELTFYETLGKKATPAFREESPPTTRKEAPAILPGSASPPAAPSTRGAAKTAGKSKETGTSGLTPSKYERYRVQVASTRDPAAARQLVDRLRKKGYAASLESIHAPDGMTQYKVRVGNYAERGPAEAVAARIRSEEKVGAWIVKVQG